MMKMMTGLCVGIAFCGLSVVAMAADYQWKLDGRVNDWDWTDSRNFVLKGTESEGAPQANDTVFVPDGLMVKARSSDATSFARVLELGRIEPMGPNAWVVFDVADEATYTGAFTAWNGVVSTSRNKGGFVKTGAGTLNLSLADRNNYTTIEVREGAVKVPQTAATQFLDTIVVSNGASFFVNSGGYTSMDRLVGEGLVTNTASTAQVLQITDGSDEPGEFGGVISSGIQLVSEGGGILLTGTNSTFGSITVKSNKGVLTEGGYIGLKMIGTEGETSSAGKVQSLNFQTDGGGFKYLGEGETATKFLNVFSSVGSYPAFLDGGPNGGLVLSGHLQLTTNYALKFFFGGDNAIPCTFAGNIKSVAGGTSSGFISKYGTGTWRFKDVSQRWFTGGIGVLDGALQFETIAEMGKKSSLGTADAVYEDWYAGPVSSAPKADYAYVFGGTNATGAATGKGLFEYVGANDVVVTSRQAVVNGTGGLKADNGAIRFVGVKAKNASGAKTLVLSGSGLTNEVQDVADGASTLSVLKEGPGTWYMSGSNTFSGSVTVKAGTLYLRDPSLYRWYRFNMKKLYNKNSSGDSSAESNFMIWCFGLYDKDGNWLNEGMKEGGRVGRILPGQAGWGTENTFEGKWEYSSNTYGNLENCFIDSNSNASRGTGRFKDGNNKVLEPDPEDVATWSRLVMRVADAAAPVTSWDFVQSGYYCWASPYNITCWSLDASTDGLRWDEVTPTENARGIWASSGNGTWSYFWYYGPNKYEPGSASVHATGKKIAAFKAKPLPAFDNLGVVSVAPEATLKTDATQNVTIKALAIDANGMGTIENFAVAEEGTVEFLNVGDRTAMPGTYVNCKDLGNLANWSVKVNGKDKPAWKVAVKDGVVSVVKPGMTVILR